MYIPTQFKSDDVAAAVELMRKHSFATLICNDDIGQPFVTYLPLHVDLRERDGRPWPALLGHVARANPHWKYLRDRGTALVSYLGPHAYMSPTVYADTKRVPTWNYLAVQCRVNVRLLNERAEMDRRVRVGNHRVAMQVQAESASPRVARRVAPDLRHRGRSGARAAGLDGSVEYVIWQPLSERLAGRAAQPPAES